MKIKKSDVGLLLLGGCFLAALVMALRQQSGEPGEKELEKSSAFASHAECNGIYYWKTGFELTDEDRLFLRKHNVQRLYLRLFDVAYEEESSEKVVPIATTTFKSKYKNWIPLSVVPTVYITLDALRQMEGKESEYADKIVTRVLAMAQGNELPEVEEVQLDCDWTQNTQSIFFSLCEEVRKLLYPKDIALSSTIRLHQLRTEAPPVDRGVLMLYNTGAIKRRNTKNSILDADDIAPYLKNVEYKLHLDFAYPAFGWGVWFRGEKFKSILRTVDCLDTVYYRRQTNGLYRVVKEHYLENHRLCYGDVIRWEESEIDEMKNVKRMVETVFPQQHSILLYHLDMNNLNKYDSNEIKSMYGTR